MKLSVLTVPLASMPLKEALSYLKKLGVQMAELGSGGYPGTAHCNPEILLNNNDELESFKRIIKESEMEISALSCHGNALHPDKKTASAAERDFTNTVLLAEKLGVDSVVTFSGCPGDSPGSLYPNWVTCAWPDDFPSILSYQWEQELIPYWKKAADFAKKHGVSKICLEMHPGFCVYNPETLLKLRSEIGDVIGANLDPSHLFWQGIDPVAAVRELGGAVYFFHAKDVYLDSYNINKNGVLDTKHYGDVKNRAWTFRTIGYGHDRLIWNSIFSELRNIGYDGAISIEHEDSLMSVSEGLEKAIAFVKEAIPQQEAGGIWWA